MHFQRSKNEKENFQTILHKTFVDFSRFSTISLPHKRNETRFYNQKKNVCAGSRVAEQLKT